MSAKIELYMETGTVIIDPEYHTRYVLKKLLGRGAYAQCYLAVIENDEMYAMKVIRLKDIKSRKVQEKLESEIAIHSRLDNRNVVRMYRSFRNDEYVFIVLELCERGALDVLLKRNGRFKEKYVARFVRQTVCGLMYLHNDENVVHRDLKLGNLFLSSKLDVKIGDFGLSAVIRNGEKKTTMCGTPNYIAPEVLFGKAGGHSYEADIWSLGVIIYTLLVGTPPFQKKRVEDIYRTIRLNNYVIPAGRDLSREAIDLITQILNTDPLERPTLEQILNHRFLTRGDTHFLLDMHRSLAMGIFLEAATSADHVVFSIPVSKLKGIGYVLQSGVRGMYFNDHRNIMLWPERTGVMYLSSVVEGGRRMFCKEEYPVESIPERIQDLYKSLLYFIRTFDIKVDFSNIKPSFIVKVRKIDAGFLFVMANGTVVFDFASGQRVVLSKHGEKVSCYDGTGNIPLSQELRQMCINTLKGCFRSDNL